MGFVTWIENSFRDLRIRNFRRPPAALPFRSLAWRSAPVRDRPHQSAQGGSTWQRKWICTARSTVSTGMDKRLNPGPKALVLSRGGSKPAQRLKPGDSPGYNVNSASNGVKMLTGHCSSNLLWPRVAKVGQWLQACPTSTHVNTPPVCSSSLLRPRVVKVGLALPARAVLLLMAVQLGVGLRAQCR